MLEGEGNLAMEWHPIQEGVVILVVASCYENWDKYRLDGPIGLSADFTSCLSHKFYFAQNYLLGSGVHLSFKVEIFYNPCAFYSVESTALRLITGLGSSEVQPQLSRFNPEPKQVKCNCSLYV